MRILITSRHLPLYTGGLASYQRQLAEKLIRHHHSAAFLAAGKGREETRDPLPGPSAILENLPPRKLEMRLASRPWLHPLLERGIAACFQRKFRDPAFVCPVPSPDVVHFIGTGWDFAGFGFHHFARTLGARFTIWPAVHPGEWGDDVIDLRLYRLADAVFCQSHQEATHLENRGLDAFKIVHCGLPPLCLPGRDGGAFRKKWAIGDRPVVLFLGRRDAGKGFPALIQAWRQVLVQAPSALLLLSGPSPHGPTPPELPAGSFLDLGIADEETKAGALAACDIFCLPSAHESFGIVFAEAWSYAKPVICGPAPASREWIRNGETGLHAEQTPESIARAVSQLLADKPLRQQLGAAGREFQQTRLTWDTILATHLRAFETTTPPRHSPTTPADKIPGRE